MKIGFERIVPTPSHPADVSAADLSGLVWSSKASVVTRFKDGLKKSLRTAQRGRCCFCRRVLYDDYAAHLEHFADKETYKSYSFEILNLALSCGTCNAKKNGHFKSWSTKFKKFSHRRGLIATSRCPVLAVQLSDNDAFPTTHSAFRWVNPHVHNYSDHITIYRGWVFHGKTREGIRTIQGTKLNELGVVEQRALSERLDSRGGKLSLLVGAIPELYQHRARDVANVIVKTIKRRRKIAAQKKDPRN